MEWIEKDSFIKFKPRLIKKERESWIQTELDRSEKLSCSIERPGNFKNLFF